MQTIELRAHGYAANGEPEPKGSMFLCGDALKEIWDHDFPPGVGWTVCLRKRTPKGRRPYKEAIKLDIPHHVQYGVRYERWDGTMTGDKMLVHDTDEMIQDKGLNNANYWCWIEVVD